MPALQDKVALITGASSGIGRATALLFAQEGARLVVCARRQRELDVLCTAIADRGGHAVAVAGDVAEPGLADELVAAAQTHFGGLDVAVGNAATLGPMGSSTDVPLSGWEHALRVNLTSAFLLGKAAVPALRKRGGGALVFTSTFVGHTVGFGGMAAYAASKAGLLGLTKALASELGRDGIRVNALLPGGTDTPMGRAVANSPEAVAHVSNLHALGRLARPEEIAQSALYLASDASSFTTGTALLADGGISIYR
jgi:NAD(P)-dependent dehydrogenase (short-subunit alcohol dehydrogenase family)